MARTRSLTDLIADVRFRADNQAATDAEITELINQSIADLYDMLCAVHGDEYFEVEAPSLTQPNVNTLSLPTNFYKLTGVWWTISGNQKVRLRKYEPMQSETLIPQSGWSYAGQVYYRLQAGNIRFLPTPLSQHTFTLKYVPAAVRLVNPGDTFDGYNGWEEWVILDAAKKLLKREGNAEDVALIQNDLDRIEQRIGEMSDRDNNEPSTVQDVTSQQSVFLRRW